MHIAKKILYCLSFSLNIYFIFHFIAFSKKYFPNKRIQSHIEAFRFSSAKLSSVYDSLTLNKFTTCMPSHDLQNCIDNSAYPTVYIAKRLHLLEKGLLIDSDKSVIIGENAYIMLFGSSYTISSKKVGGAFWPRWDYIFHLIKHDILNLIGYGAPSYMEHLHYLPTH